MKSSDIERNKKTPPPLPAILPSSFSTAFLITTRHLNSLSLFELFQRILSCIHDALLKIHQSFSVLHYPLPLGGNPPFLLPPDCSFVRFVRWAQTNSRSLQFSGLLAVLFHDFNIFFSVSREFILCKERLTILVD